MKAHYFIFCVAILLLICCKSSTDKSYFNGNSKIKLIDSVFMGEKPMVSLVNMPAYSLLSDSFVLQQKTSLQIYSVGELIYNLADGPQSSFFKGDDFSLYFKQKNKEREDAGWKEIKLSWSEAQGRKGRATIKKDGLLLEGYQDMNKGKYVAEIQIPWNYFQLSPAYGDSIDFNIRIGDTDDEFRQEKAVSWCPLVPDVSGYKCNKGGNIILEEGIVMNEHGDASNCMKALKGTILVDSVADDLWNKIRETKIACILYGIVKDKYDLSASVKAAWDIDYLYLRLDIVDGNRRRIWEKNVRTMQTFLDYGWIENEKGARVWEMHALDSKHAGGALKNQYVDTLLTLDKGKYFVKYTSDECHSYGNWDDDPPLTPFYGILMYHAKKVK